jgi:hypothetical protein
MWVWRDTRRIPNLRVMWNAVVALWFLTAGVVTDPQADSANSPGTTSATEISEPNVRPSETTKFGAHSLESPQLVRWTPPRRFETEAGDTMAHFIVCQVHVQATGRTDSVNVLGCEGAKQPLCDSLIAALGAADFLPARRGGKPEASTCVFGVTFPAGRTGAARAGVPLIGYWADSLCAYDGRIYGSAELAPESRPVVIRRTRAAYPEQARGYSAVARVKLRAVIDTAGVPCFVLCDSSVPPVGGFAEAAAAAALRFRYRPGTIGGRPQAVWVEVEFRWDPQE